MVIESTGMVEPTGSKHIVTYACGLVGYDKDKEALFNVAYNVTDNISS